MHAGKGDVKIQPDGILGPSVAERFEFLYTRIGLNLSGHQPTRQARRNRSGEKNGPKLGTQK